MIERAQARGGGDGEYRPAARTRRSALRASGAGALGLVGTFLAGSCGQRQGGPTAPSAISGQITFMSRDNGSDLEPYKQGLALFNSRQSRIQVQHDIVSGNFEQKLQTVVAGGTPPDVSYMHSQNIPTFVTIGIVAANDSYLRRDKTALDGLLPAALDAYRWRNTLNGVPDVATSLVMFINRSAFTKMGVAAPGDKWTWSDYLAAAQKLATAGRAEGLFGAVDYNGNFPKFTVLWQNEADLLNNDRTQVTIDRPEAVEAISWIADQMLKSRVLAGPADLQGRGAEQFFLDGKAAMLPSISSRMGIIATGAQFEVELAHLPQGRKRVTRTAVGGTAMIKGSKNPDAGWELEKFFAADEFQWLMAKVGGIIFPAHRKVAESPDLFASGTFPKNPKVSVDAMAYARTEPYTVRYPDMSNALNKELDAVWQGQSSVKDALMRAKAAIEPILQDALSQIKNG